MIPFYQRIFQDAPDVDVLVYSGKNVGKWTYYVGDVDVFTVPFGYTQACLSQLEDEVEEAWQPWFVNEATAGNSENSPKLREMLGYVEKHKHFTFATVKGAGHEAPQYQPLTAWNMMSRYLSSNKLTGVDEPKRGRSSQRMTQGRLLKKYGIRV